MPIVAVNLPLTIFTEIDALVTAGLYTSPEQFLEIAAYNQLALERGTKVGDLVARRAPQGSQKGRAELRPRLPSVTSPTAQIYSTVDEGVWTAVVQRLRRVEINADRLPKVLPVTPVTDRIWGQVNRYLPMKVATRWIAVQAAQRQEWPELASTLVGVTEDATLFGSRVEFADRQLGRTREQMLSIGLPRTDNSQSQDRFVTQIIARVTRSDRFHAGALFHYAFAALDGSRVALTAAGLKFAELDNPVIDGDLSSTAETLGEDERKYVVQHVIDHVSAELEDFRVVADAIRNGHDGPDALIRASRERLPSSWTELAARTHVYGLLARMVELGLVTKTYVGRRVTYSNAQLPSILAA
jgi:hypothetical protein